MMLAFSATAYDVNSCRLSVTTTHRPKTAIGNQSPPPRRRSPLPIDLEVHIELCLRVVHAAANMNVIGIADAPDQLLHNASIHEKETHSIIKMVVKHEESKKWREERKQKRCS